MQAPDFCQSNSDVRTVGAFPVPPISTEMFYKALWLREEGPEVELRWGLKAWAREAQVQRQILLVQYSSNHSMTSSYRRISIQLWRGNSVWLLIMNFLRVMPVWILRQRYLADWAPARRHSCKEGAKSIPPFPFHPSPPLSPFFVFPLQFLPSLPYSPLPPHCSHCRLPFLLRCEEAPLNPARDWDWEWGGAVSCPSGAPATITT